LYDLAKDPQELNNVAVQNPAIVKKIESMMKKAHQQNPDWPLLPDEIKK